ncbi:Bifunctional protein FolD protein [bacterium HR19]|nr:Bifunctional protein FolD protein [bacterium HR19]
MSVEVNGKAIAQRIFDEVRNKVLALKRDSYNVRLSIIAIGNDSEMELYIRNKRKYADYCGIEIEVFYFPADVSEGDLVQKIYELNSSDCSGFIVQLPLPSHIRKDVLDIIYPLKDVDCLTSENLGKVLKDYRSARFLPCASQAMIDIFEEYKVAVEGKKAVVVGASDLVGKPCASVLVNMGATVTICHRATKDLSEYIKDADIVISAVGIPGLIKGEWIKRGAVVIDIGTRVVDGKVFGDVEYDEAKKRASIITPVPGGVGIITVAELMRNTLKAFFYSSSAIGSPSTTEPPSWM